MSFTSNYMQNLYYRILSEVILFYLFRARSYLISFVFNQNFSLLDRRDPLSLLSFHRTSNRYLHFLNNKLGECKFHYECKTFITAYKFLTFSQFTKINWVSPTKVSHRNASIAQDSQDSQDSR